MYLTTKFLFDVQIKKTKMNSAFLNFQTPSTAISWSVYEFFKHYMSSGGFDGPNSDQQNDKYDTLSSNSRNFQNGLVGSRVSHLSSGRSNSSNSEEINPSRHHGFSVVAPVVSAAR